MYRKNKRVSRFSIFPAKWKNDERVQLTKMPVFSDTAKYGSYSLRSWQSYFQNGRIKWSPWSRTWSRKFNKLADHHLFLFATSRYWFSSLCVLFSSRTLLEVDTLLFLFLEKERIKEAAHSHSERCQCTFVEDSLRNGWIGRRKSVQQLYFYNKNF